ncbi:transposase [Mesorhizobium sp. B3-2-1]|uniref:transposase n=1 Tax=Mesorhizobium sp. B3-2-1 TaxID=2589891 RepID=UPI0015E39667|nr:transposase [Mesorhizobium sp. B3-2-1]
MPAAATASSAAAKASPIKGTLRLAAGARLFFLPKYSPDLNPIEQLFSKLKHWLRKAASRTVQTVCDAIGQILNRITPTECSHYFENSRYDRN